MEAVRLKWELAVATPPRAYNVVDIWHHCAKVARQFMRGWGANVGAELRKTKAEILDQIQTLDVMADSLGLTADACLQRYALETSLMEIYYGEEIFWRQRRRQNWILCGDANMAYFHAIANGRRRRCSMSY